MSAIFRIQDMRLAYVLMGAGLSVIAISCRSPSDTSRAAPQAAPSVVEPDVPVYPPVEENLKSPSADQDRSVHGARSDHNERGTKPDVEIHSDVLAPRAYAQAVDDADLDKQRTSARCSDDEAGRGVVWTRSSDRDELVRAQLEISANGGHDNWKYAFYYRDDQPVLLEHRLVDWTWAEGRAAEGVTRDAVVQRTYVVEGVDVKTCSKTTATALSTEIEDVLAHAPSETADCEDGPRLMALAQQAKKPIADTAWLNDLCQSPDPSQDWLIAERRKRAG